MKAALRKSNVFGRAAWLAVLIAAVSAPSSYGNGFEPIIFYGTPTGPEFGIINPDTWALEPIGITAEPDGPIPGPDPNRIPRPSTKSVQGTGVWHTTATMDNCTRYSEVGVAVVTPT